MTEAFDGFLREFNVRERRKFDCKGFSGGDWAKFKKLSNCVEVIQVWTWRSKLICRFGQNFINRWGNVGAISLHAFVALILEHILLCMEGSKIHTNYFPTTAQTFSQVYSNLTPPGKIPFVNTNFVHLHLVPDFILLLRLEMEIYCVYFQATRILGITKRSRIIDLVICKAHSLNGEMQFHKSENSPQTYHLLGMQHRVPNRETFESF